MLHATIHRHLTQSLGMETRDLKREPRVLRDELREKRITFSRGLLKMLKAQGTIVFRDVMTGDEGQKQFDERTGSIWLSSEQEVPTRAQLATGSEMGVLVVQGIVHRIRFPKDMQIMLSSF
jgi:hypothetical protein